MDHESKTTKLIPEFAPILLGKLGISPHDDDADRLWPNLMQLLLPKYDSSHRLTREAGVLTLRVDGSLFRVSVVCPSEAVQTAVAMHSVVDLLSQVERYLSSDMLDWTPTFDKKKRAGQALKNVLGS